MGRINETAKDGRNLEVFNTAAEVTVSAPGHSQRSRSSLPWEHEYTDRLVHLFSNFSALRQDSRQLVTQLRGSIHQMRELRVQLRARATGPGPYEARPWGDGLSERYGLTRRELEAAKLLAQGKSNAAIARELRISGHTARHHTQRILSKLAVHSRAEAGAKLRG